MFQNLKVNFFKEKVHYFENRLFTISENIRILKCWAKKKRHLSIKLKYLIFYFIILNYKILIESLLY